MRKPKKQRQEFSSSAEFGNKILYDAQTIMNRTYWQPGPGPAQHLGEQLVPGQDFIPESRAERLGGRHHADEVTSMEQLNQPAQPDVHIHTIGAIAAAGEQGGIRR